LQEVETHYSLTDLMDAHEALDLLDYAERKAAKEAAR